MHARLSPPLLFARGIVLPNCGVGSNLCIGFSLFGLSYYMMIAIIA